MKPNVDLINDFLTQNEAEMLFEVLKKGIEWKQEKIKIFGKEVVEPRLVAWYGDKAYKYSGKLMQPQPWTKELLEIKSIIEENTGYKFNNVLLNYYRNGLDSMGWHSDDEAELGKNPVIASLSLGQERRFQFRFKADKSIKVHYLLSSGSLLLMKNDCQHLWQHQVPKSGIQVGERINLTFRLIV